MANSLCVSFEEELRNNPELKKADIQTLSEWCKKQPHLPFISDSELAIFLHSNYYKMEPTKLAIDKFYTIRTHTPEHFSNRDPETSEELQLVTNTLCMVPLEKRTKEGYTIFWLKFVDTNPAKYCMNDSIKHMCMSVDLWMYQAGTRNNGHYICVDCTGSTLGHLARISPMGFKKWLHYLQEAVPVRLKGLHLLNYGSFLENLMSLVKPLLQKEYLDLIHIHSSLESLNKAIPLELLPTEMGGKSGPITLGLSTAQFKKFKEHRDWFLDEEKRARIDESKRPEKDRAAAMEFIGCQGSFKKLDFD